MASGGKSASSQANIGIRCAALHDGAGRDEGVAGIHDHLQPGASGDAAGGGTTRGGDGADQFRGCVALAAAGTTRGGGATVTRESGAAGAGGTAGEKAP